MDEQDRAQPMTEDAPSPPVADGEAPAAARAQDLPADEPTPPATPAAGGEAPAAEAAQPEPAPLDAVLDAPETSAAPAPAAVEPDDAAPASAPPAVAEGDEGPGHVEAAPALADETVTVASEDAAPVLHVPAVDPEPEAEADAGPGDVALAPGLADEAVPAATEDAPPAVPAGDEPTAPPQDAAAHDATAATNGDGGDAAPVGDDAAEDRPLIGPRILTNFVPRPIDAPPPLAPSRSARPQPERPKRRRVTSAQRHRNIFFQRLNELRRTGRPPQEDAEEDGGVDAATVAAEPTPAPDAPVAEAPPAEPTAEEPAPVAPTAHPEPDAVPAPEPSEAVESEQQGADPEQGPPEPQADGSAAPAPAAEQPAPARPRTPPPPIDRPRLVAAIERVGGEEVVREALKPKRDEDEQPMKWAVVCADAARGLKPGDPAYTAWLRLAATPVSAIKDAVGVEDERRGRRRGPGGGGRPDGRGGDRRGPRGDRPDRGERVSRDDLARLGSGGRVGANVRIIGADDDDKKAREQRRKEQREAKRQAERERLARLGY